MVQTPWGDSEGLRERRLTPGPGTAAEAVAENQRQRLFGAMVASVDARGYGATRVSDLAETSGVSSRSFYNLFPGGKEECFLAVLGQILDTTLEMVSAAAKGTGDWEERLSAIYSSFAEVIAAQPATASLVLTDAYAAGPTAVSRLEHTSNSFERLTRRWLDESPDLAGMPAAMIQAQVGALQELARARLRHQEPEELKRQVPELVDLVSAYRPPPHPLRLATRTQPFDLEAGVGSDDAERAIRGFILATAEHGFDRATIHEIARLGAMSPSTFYANFRDKREALLAAIDTSMAQLGALAMAAYRRSPGWAPGVRAAIGSALNFLASRPATANLLLVEVYAGGPEALDVRARGVHALGKTLVEGAPRPAAVPPIAGEVIGGGIAALARRQYLRKGAESLPSLAPVATYLALCPYIGPDEACVAANGDGRGQSPAPERSRLPELAMQTTKWYVHAMLGNRWATAQEVADEIDAPVAEISALLEQLEKDGLIERLVAADGSKPDEWANVKLFRVIDGEDWEALTPEERQRFTIDSARLAIADLEQVMRQTPPQRRLDEHHTRVTLELDEEGWAEIAEIHRAAFNASQVVRTKSEKRLRQHGGDVIKGRSMQYLYEFPDDE